MDPQACFKLFCIAVRAGNYDAAADAQADYLAWRCRGGFAARDNGADVQRLDGEQDRYLVRPDDSRPAGVRPTMPAVWRSVGARGKYLNGRNVDARAILGEQ